MNKRTTNIKKDENKDTDKPKNGSIHIDFDVYDGLCYLKDRTEMPEV